MHILPTRVLSLIVGTLFLLSPLAVQANADDPNGSRNSPQPGWGLWRRKAEIAKADFDSGFSNSELGGYLDFENFCTTNGGSPNTQIDYWFRLSNSVNRIGTGNVEFGCWAQGRFLNTYSSTAIKKSLSNVNCLRVYTPNKKSLVIWAEPRANSKKVGVVANRRTVKPESFPASIVEVNGENWIAIASPKKGWVSDGSSASPGNLRLCSLKNP
ncbi:hypothetical protein [Calothrix sp. PCC 7507]|uniref:hypothetical protein n=1 Tax=Calothrix sp. PCC 7507 TaxID=99598 RepID=UPI0002D665D7|nr:hypothetical protein [Calothrix sp. PCC 7507]